MATRLITADSSVVIPLISPWHESHAEMVDVASRVTCLPGHVILETVSSVSRMPHGLTAPVASAVALLESRFPDEPLTLAAQDLRRLLSLVSGAHLGGGRVYDALVGYTAYRAGATLLSRDRRAEGTYLAVGVDYDLVV